MFDRDGTRDAGTISPIPITADPIPSGPYLQQFRVTVRTLGKIRDDDLDPAFCGKLLDAFRGLK
jgi:hypothetical protein